jgi:hypothetical protein
MTQEIKTYLAELEEQELREVEENFSEWEKADIKNIFNCEELEI